MSKEKEKKIAIVGKESIEEAVEETRSKKTTKSKADSEKPAKSAKVKQDFEKAENSVEEKTIKSRAKKKLDSNEDSSSKTTAKRKPKTLDGEASSENKREKNISRSSKKTDSQRIDQLENESEIHEEELASVVLEPEDESSPSPRPMDRRAKLFAAVMSDVYAPSKPLQLAQAAKPEEFTAPAHTQDVVDEDREPEELPPDDKPKSQYELLRQAPELMARMTHPAEGPSVDLDEIKGMEIFPFSISPAHAPRKFDAEFIARPIPSYFQLTEPNERVRQHTISHCSMIMALIKDWLEKLEAIESSNASDGEFSAQAYRIRVFEKILETNFELADKHGFMLPDQQIAIGFELDSIQLLIVWICVSLQVDPEVRKFMAAVTPFGQPIYVSPALILRTLCHSNESRLHVKSLLAPSSQLVSKGLLTLVHYKRPTLPLYNEIVVAEQVINIFSGFPSVSSGVMEYAELQIPQMGEEVFLAPNHEETLKIVSNFITRPSLADVHKMGAQNLNIVPSLAFFVEGLPGSGRNTLIKIISSRLQYPVITVNCSPLLSLDVTSFEEFMQAVFMDAQLLGCILCMRNAGPMLNDARMAASLADQLAKRPVAVALCIDLSQPTHACLDPYITFKTKIDADLKENAIAYWKPHVELPNVDQSRINLKYLTDKLSLQPFQIQKAAKLAYFASDYDESAQEVLMSDSALERAASAQVSKNIGGLAFITDPEITLKDVIVNNDIEEKLKQIIGSARERRKVLYEWGIAKRIKRGTGIIALFDGEPGTGKTHSAEAIARELGLSLMRINIASLVDKYIGETEKNLTTIFEQARPDMSLLLFDEADSLFTKRSSSVSKSTDRYSNMSINVLLQLIERYEGVSVLTTNLKAAIDPAFERRITYKVYFPMPKEPERKRLWKYLCPPYIVTDEEIDYDWLSELELSGGEIKNSVLTAAYKAATLGKLLDNDLLYDAGVSEAVAAGRVTRRNIDDLPPNPIFD